MVLRVSTVMLVSLSYPLFPMDDPFLNLTEDPERIMNHAKAIRAVQERALELEHAMRTTLDADLTRLRSEFDLSVGILQSEGSECAAVATLQLAQHNGQFQEASIDTIMSPSQVPTERTATVSGATGEF